MAASLIIFLMLTVINFTGGGILKAEASQTFERVDFISGVVIANELNMRTGPSTKHSIIQVLKKNKWVNVLSKIGDWYVVYDPDNDKVGCVAKQYLMDGETLRSKWVPVDKSHRNLLRRRLRLHRAHQLQNYW